MADIHRVDEELSACIDSVLSSDEITFVLGAGGSISSGAPPTRTVDSYIQKSVETRRFEGEELGHAFAQITRDERIRSVSRLFDGSAPHLGYHCLVALARHRLVRIVTFNWDENIELAARKQHVECASFDHMSSTEEVTQAFDRNARLIVFHPHGTITTDILHGAWLTSAMPDLTVDLLADKFFSQTTVILGTSVSDIDLRRAYPFFSRTDRLPPIWALLRDEVRPEVRGDLSRLLMYRASARNIITDPHIDFDRVMIETLAVAKSVDLQDKSAATDWGRTVLPRSELLRHKWDSRLILIAGEARLGKTTLAHLLIQWNSLVAATTAAVLRTESLHDVEKFVRSKALDPARPVILVFDVSSQDPDYELLASSLERLRDFVCSRAEARVVVCLGAAALGRLVDPPDSQGWRVITGNRSA